MQLYHNSSEREPIVRAGDNSRSKKSEKLAELSQGRFLVIAHEALGLNYKQTLDSSIALIEAMLQEYAYICNERNRSTKGEEEDDGESEWMTMPDFENGGMKRMKKGNI